MPDTPDDAQFMLRALDLAHRGQGYVEPNPMVGCLIVRGGKIVGEGWHQQFGGPHAEVAGARSQPVDRPAMRRCTSRLSPAAITAKRLLAPRRFSRPDQAQSSPPCAILFRKLPAAGSSDWPPRGSTSRSAS